MLYRFYCFSYIFYIPLALHPVSTWANIEMTMKYIFSSTIFLCHHHSSFYHKNKLKTSQWRGWRNYHDCITAISFIMHNSNQNRLMHCMLSSVRAFTSFVCLLHNHITPAEHDLFLCLPLQETREGTYCRKRMIPRIDVVMGVVTVYSK